MKKKPLFPVLLVVLIIILGGFESDFKVRRATENYIKSIHQDQKENNGFVFSLFNSTHKKTFYTPFGDSIIGYSLYGIREDFDTGQILSKSADYVNNARYNGTQLWSFYDKNYTSIGLGPLPPDLDDTANAIIFLQKMNYSVDKNKLRAVLKYQKDDGTFYVWTVNVSKFRLGSSPTETDCVVDVSVMTMLNMFNISTGSTCENINRIIKNDSHASCSTYYKNFFPFAYFVSRAYSENSKCIDKKALIELTLKKLNDDTTPLDMCLALSTFNKLNYREGAARQLFKTIINMDEGIIWETYPFFAGALQSEFFGSPSLTASVCAEAVWNHHKGDA